MTISKTRLLSVLALAAVASVAVAQLAVAEAPPESVRVEFQMYSGREDPFVLIDDPALLAKLKDSVGKSRRLSRDSLAASREYEMGYSGTTIRSLTPGAALPEEILIHRRQIVTKRGPSGAARATPIVSYAEDSAGDLETTLIEHAASIGALSPNERTYLLREAKK